MHGPNQLWVGDITFVAVATGFVYLAVLLDAWSRRVVGYALDRHLDARLVTAALGAAIAARRPLPGCLVHSDRGVQYASKPHRALLAAHGLVGSMSRRGNPYDNPKADSFFKTLKVEAVYVAYYETFADVALASEDVVEFRAASEWEFVEPFMPPRAPIGRPRRTDLREVWNAIQYIAATGCQWALLPKDFPPFTTVQYYFYQLRDSGVLPLINETLAAGARLLAGRAADPTAGVIDSQSVQTTESGGPRGYDGGKKVKGRKRHIVTDTQGLVLTGIVHPADIHDSDDAPDLVETLMAAFPTVTLLFADRGYVSGRLHRALRDMNGPEIQLVLRPANTPGFVPLPRRWVVERAFAWLNRCRRLAKDWEASISSSEAWLLIASIRQITRRLAAAHRT